MRLKHPVITSVQPCFLKQYVDTYNQETKDIDSSEHDDGNCSIKKKDEMREEREREKEKEREKDNEREREREIDREREGERERETERFTLSDCQNVNKQLRDACATGSVFAGEGSSILASTFSVCFTVAMSSSTMFQKENLHSLILERFRTGHFACRNTD